MKTPTSLPPVGTVWFYKNSPSILVIVTSHKWFCDQRHVAFRRLDIDSSCHESIGMWNWHFKPLGQEIK